MLQNQRVRVAVIPRNLKNNFDHGDYVKHFTIPLPAPKALKPSDAQLFFHSGVFLEKPVVEFAEKNREHWVWNNKEVAFHDWLCKVHKVRQSHIVMSQHFQCSDISFVLSL